MKITYVYDDSLGSRFGECDSSGNIKINGKLPQLVIDFVLDHELYHRFDRKNWKNKKGIWSLARKEFLANFYSARKHPIGFLATMILKMVY